MRFDRSAPGEGVEVECVPKNGKALLSWRFRFTGERSGALLLVTVKDTEGNRVLECLHREPEEEPLQAVLLHPKLWCCTERPYLYQMEVCLLNREGLRIDKVVRPLPLRRLERLPGKGYFLNGTLFQPKTVNYVLPETIAEAECQSRMFQDLELLLWLGANSIYCNESDKVRRGLQQLCDRLGILMWPEASEVSLRGGEQCLLDNATDSPSTFFFQCMTHWSSRPFVYIAPESVVAASNGGFSAVVYSNCDKVALYTDGVLFEVHCGEEKFVFEDIPARRPCIMLTAEADGCIISLSIQKSCIKKSAVSQALTELGRRAADSGKTSDKQCESPYIDLQSIPTKNME